MTRPSSRGVKPMVGTVMIGSPPPAKVWSMKTSVEAVRQGAGIRRHDVLEEVVVGGVVHVDPPVVAGGRVAAPAPHRPMQILMQGDVAEVDAVDPRVDRPAVEAGADRDRHRAGRLGRVGIDQQLDHVDPNRGLVATGAGLQHHPVVNGGARRADRRKRDGDGGPAVRRQVAAGQVAGERNRAEIGAAELQSRGDQLAATRAAMNAEAQPVVRLRRAGRGRVEEDAFPVVRLEADRAGARKTCVVLFGSWVAHDQSCQPLSSAVSL